MAATEQSFARNAKLFLYGQTQGTVRRKSVGNVDRREAGGPPLKSTLIKKCADGNGRNFAAMAKQIEPPEAAEFRARQSPDGKWLIERLSEGRLNGVRNIWGMVAEDVEEKEISATIERLVKRAVRYFDKDGKLIE